MTPQEKIDKFDNTSMDAKVWAKEFMRLYQKKYNWEVDEELMIGWFANAIMAGYDRANRKIAKAISDRIKEKL